MGVSVVVVGNKHTCPMSDGTKAHKGGTVTEGINDVLIDGIPVAVEGSKCICDGSPKPNAIAVGNPGVLVDGKPIAIVGSATEHGGVVVEGVPGVTISGGFPFRADDPEKLEPRIFNLRWMKGSNLINSDYLNEDIVFRASTVGFEDGEEVEIKLYNDNGDVVIDQKVTVNQGEVEIKIAVENNHFEYEDDNE